MRLFYAMILLLGLSANGFAQINPGMPSWVDDTPFALGGDVGHPALSGIDAVWLDGVLNQVGQITVNSHIILFHPRHGDLGVRKLESSGLTSDVGTLSTGLQYVLGLRSFEQPDANGVSQVVGFYVTGLKSNGKSSVFYCPWSGVNPPPTNLALTELIPEAPAGRVYIVGDIVENRLYVFDAAGENVYRYVDSDADGLPDTPDTVAPLSLATKPAGALIREPVLGFYRPAGTTDDAFHWGSSKHRWGYWRVAADQGVLKASWKRIPRPPRFDAEGVCDGQNKIRAHHDYGKKVVVYAGVSVSQMQLISHATVVSDNLHQWVDVGLTRPLRQGEVIQLRDADDGALVSYLETVAPRRHFLMESEEGTVWESVPVSFPAFDVSPSTTVVTGKLGNVLVALDVKISQNSVVIETPVLAGGTSSASLLVEATDSRFPGVVSRQTINVCHKSN